MKKAVPFVASGIITGIAMVTLSFFIDDSTQANGTLYAGLIAAITIAAIPIYDIDTWSLTKRSAAHFVLMVCTVFPLLLMSGWFSAPVAVVVFLLFGAVGWTIGYTVNRVQEAKAR